MQLLIMDRNSKRAQQPPEYVRNNQLWAEDGARSPERSLT